MAQALYTYLAPGIPTVAVDRLNPQFATSLAALFNSLPVELRNSVRINSAFRTPERQAELFKAAVAKYGSEEAARKWVAPPGRSKHNEGAAVDLKYIDPAAKEYIHANAKNFGLNFPMSHEDWHIEPVGARNMVMPADAANAGAPVDNSAQPTAPSEQDFNLAALGSTLRDLAKNMGMLPTPTKPRMGGDTQVNVNKIVGDGRNLVLGGGYEL